MAAADATRPGRADDDRLVERLGHDLLERRDEAVGLEPERARIGTQEGAGVRPGSASKFPASSAARYLPRTQVRRSASARLRPRVSRAAARLAPMSNTVDSDHTAGEESRPALVRGKKRQFFYRFRRLAPTDAVRAQP
jgi:hypothetical protein